MALRKLDARGLKCPMPIVKAKKEIDGMSPGEELEVTSTDSGSVPDFQGWVRTAKNVILKAQRTEQDDRDSGRNLYIHLLERK